MNKQTIEKSPQEILDRINNNEPIDISDLLLLLQTEAVDYTTLLDIMNMHSTKDIPIEVRRDFYTAVESKIQENLEVIPQEEESKLLERLQQLSAAGMLKIGVDSAKDATKKKGLLMGAKALVGTGASAISSIVSAIPSMASFLFYVGIVVIPAFIVVILIIAMASIFQSNKTVTGLSYYEAENFYGLPYNPAYKNLQKDYGSIFDYHPEFLPDEMDKNVVMINEQIDEYASKIKVGDLQLGKKDCNDYCDLYLNELFKIELVVADEYKIDDYKIHNLVNSTIGKSGVHYIALNVKNLQDEGKDYNMYLYDLIYKDQDVKSSLFQSSLDDQEYTLFLTQNLEQISYDEDNDEDGTVQAGNIIQYINDYFLSTNHFNNRVDDQIMRGDIDEIFVSGMTKLFVRNPQLKKNVIDVITEAVYRDYTILYDSNMVDMLNFTGISGGNRETSLSNQYLLSEEKVDLTIFNKKRFGKNYKQLILYPDEIGELKQEDIEKILNYTEDDKDSNEFGYYIENDIGYFENASSLSQLRQEKKPATNNTPIYKVGAFYYSDDFKIPSQYQGLCNFTAPNIPDTQNGAIPYTKEAMYSGQIVKASCIDDGEPFSISINAKPIIQKSSIVFYKKFIFQDENPQSIRRKNEHFLNYFYDKSYLEKDGGAYASVNLVNNIFLDRESILFKGIYLRITGFGLEIKDTNGDILITSKKEAKSFQPLFSDAPIKFELGILTDLNQENKNVKEFEEKNNPYKEEFQALDTELFTNSEDPEINVYNYDKIYDMNKENSLLSYMDTSPHRRNQNYKENIDFYNMNKNFTGTLLNKKDLDSVFANYANRQVTNFLTKEKNNSFYNITKKKKFSRMLDEIFGIVPDEEVNISSLYKKNLIIMSDITECFNSSSNKEAKECFIREYNKDKGKFVLNENLETYDNTLSEKAIINTTSFNNCDFYRNTLALIGPTLYNIRNVDKDKEIKNEETGIRYQNSLTQKKYNRAEENYIMIQNNINNNIILPCYQDFQSIDAIKKVSLTSSVPIAEQGDIIESIYYSSINPELYDNINIEKYRLLSKENPKALEFYYMLTNGQDSIVKTPIQSNTLTDIGDTDDTDTDTDDIDTDDIDTDDIDTDDIDTDDQDDANTDDTDTDDILDNLDEIENEIEYNYEYKKVDMRYGNFGVTSKIKDIIIDENKDGLEQLWEKYTSTNDYKNNCYSSGTLRETAEDKNFTCSLEDIYTEFLDKVLENPKYYSFLKEEYLLEQIEDEPFTTYYHTDLLQECKSLEICVPNDRDIITISSKKFIPPKLKDSKYVTPRRVKDYSETKVLKGLEDNKNFYNNTFLSNNGYITDFTYHLNLNNAFSYKPKDYSPQIELHTIPINPNIYLHAFIQEIKEQDEKYNINVYGTGFDSILSDHSKKDFEKELVIGFNTYFSSNVSLYRLYLDTKNMIDNLQLNSNYQKTISTNWENDSSMLDGNYQFNKYVAQHTINKNLSDYVDNITVKSLTPKLKELNKQTNSLNYIRIPYSKIKEFYNDEDNFQYTYSGNVIDTDYQPSKRLTYFNKFLYSIFILDQIDKETTELSKYKFNKISSIAKNNKKDSVTSSIINMYNTATLNIAEEGIMTKLQTYREVFLTTSGMLPDMYHLKLSDNFFKRMWQGAGNRLSYIFRRQDKLRYSTQQIVDLNYDLLAKFTKIYDNDKDDFKEKKQSLLNSVLYNEYIEAKDGSTEVFDYDFSKMQESVKESLILGKNITVTEDEKKREDVLWLNIYYGDLFGNAKKYDKNMSESELQYLINIHKQLLLFAKSMPIYYEDLYIKPVNLTNKKVFEDLLYSEEHQMKVEKFFDLYTKKYEDDTGFVKPTYEGYMDYMSIVYMGIDRLNVYKFGYLTLPLDSISDNYEYHPSEFTDPDTIWNDFLNGGFSQNFAYYNFISDLFQKDPTNIRNQTVEQNIHEYYEDKIKDEEKLLQSLEKENSDDENIQNAIKYKKRSIANLKNVKKSFSPLDTYTIRISDNHKIEIIAINRVDENGKETNIGINNKEEYNKFLFFTGPFDSYNDRQGFYTVGQRDLILELYSNNMLNLLFGLNNVSTTEKGLRKIVDELQIYAEDVSNEEIKSFKNTENIGNFYYIYVNNGYVDARGSDALRFEIQLGNGVDSGSDLFGGSGGMDVFTLRNASNKKVLNARFDQLKTQYCEKVDGTDSDKQNCKNYMDYLKTMTLSELNAEMHYLTAYTFIKDKPRADNFNFSGNLRLRHLFKDAKDPEDLKALQEYYQVNGGIVGQCAWFVLLLKDIPAKEGEGWGHAQTYYSRGKAAGYPTDPIDSYNESFESLFSKIRPGDIFSVQRANYGHVGIIKDVHPDTNEVTVVESNALGVMIVSDRRYSVRKLGVGGVVHGVDWRY